MNNKTFRQKLDHQLNARHKTDIVPFIKIAGYLIYISGLVYAGSHVLSFIDTVMADPFLKIMGYIGGVGIILNGAILPLTIHNWTMEPVHRGTAMLFYALDLFLIAGFVWSNTNLVLGTGLELAEGYMNWISPLTFMNTILTWGILTIVDPEKRQEHRIKRAQMEYQEIEIQTATMLAIADAERRSQTALLEAGIDPDTFKETRTPTRTTGPTYIDVGFEPEPDPFPSRERVGQEEISRLNQKIRESSGYSGQFKKAEEATNQNHSGNHSGYSPKA